MKPPDRLKDDAASSVGQLLSRVPPPRPSPGAGQRAWRAFEARRAPRSNAGRLGWFALGAAVATAATVLVMRPGAQEVASTRPLVASAPRVLEQLVAGRLEVRAEQESVEVRTPAEVLIVSHAVAAIEVRSGGEVVVRVLQGAVYLRGRDAWVAEGGVETLAAPVKPAAVEVPVAPPAPARPAQPPVPVVRPPSAARELVPVAAPVEVAPAQAPAAAAPSEQERLRAALSQRATAPREAAAQLRALLDSPTLGEAAGYELGRLEAGALRDPAAAVATLRQVRARFPGGALRGELAVSLAEALLAAGVPSEALTELDGVAALPAGRERRDELATLRGEVFRTLGRLDDAAAVLGPVAEGASPFAERALLLLADCEARRGRVDAARAALQRYLERFPTGARAGEVRRSLGLTP